jgi:hypothetical protein
MILKKIIELVVNKYRGLHVGLNFEGNGACDPVAIHLQQHIIRHNIK